MKRWIAALLCLMLLTGCAFAEDATRTREMILEGIAEEVKETLYRDEGGYSIWYPSEYLEPGEQYGRPCFYPVGHQNESEIYFLIVEADANPADAEGLLAEAVGGFGPGAVISEPKWTTTESGALLGSVQAQEDGTVYRYYLAAGEEKLLMITACFLEEAAEGFGVRFDRMAETISFVVPDAVYEGEEYSIGYFAEQLAAAKLGEHTGFVPVGTDGESGVSLMIVKSGVAPENADALLDEAVGGYDGLYAVTRGEEQTIAGGLTLNWIQAEQEGAIDRYYLIKGEQDVYCLTASFPVVDEVDYGVLFDAMAESFRLKD